MATLLLMAILSFSANIVASEYDMMAMLRSSNSSGQLYSTDSGVILSPVVTSTVTGELIFS